MQTTTPVTTAKGGTTSAGEFLDRLLLATNAHDVAAIVECFGPDYRNETPAHPSRGFRGADQVRRNWEQILTHVPDLVATVPRRSVDGDTVWAEMEMSGTRRDGAAHRMRGVVIFGVSGDRAEWARFYMEPVTDGGENVNQAVHRHVAPASGDTT